MEASAAFLTQLTEGQRMLELVMGDVTPEMLAWTPSENVQPIGAIYAHAVGLEDLYIQQIIRNKPLLWEVEIKDYVKLQVARARYLLDSAIKDTPPEMVNHKIGEHCNMIAAVYAHVIGGEDYFVNMAIQGKPLRRMEL